MLCLLYCIEFIVLYCTVLYCIVLYCIVYYTLMHLSFDKYKYDDCLLFANASDVMLFNVGSKS